MERAGAGSCSQRPQEALPSQTGCSVLGSSRPLHKRLSRPPTAARAQVKMLWPQVEGPFALGMAGTG